MTAILDELNPNQKEAVMTTEGPLLILAGAGSGKTKTLTNRIAYLIQEKGVKPWNILALTFTNKAAAEMKERIEGLVEYGADAIWMSTFHSCCVRILRRYADMLGYTSSFTIYDSDDSRTLMKQVLKKMNLDSKLYKDRSVLSVISSAKNELIGPARFERENAGDFRMSKISEIYREYQSQLLSNNAMDFDDLLVNTVTLLQTAPDVLEDLRDRFKYICVDEYQDTNTAQFQMVKLLADAHHNLCVVGDDDQSIYKFRGANIRNILDFEKAFPDAKVIKLEQNYRSTKNILAAANAVIGNNHGRKAKSLWTDNEEGDKVALRQYDSAYSEADAIVRDIIQNKDTYSYGRCAVLYRTNAQSRIIEEKCITYNVPYRLVGGVNFYQRKEIKDLLCYLKVIDNGRDDLAVQRVINVPRRGIGATTIAKVSAYASDYGMSFFDVISDEIAMKSLGRAAAKIEPFVKKIQVLRSQAEYMTVKDLLEQVLESTGYKAELEADETVESQTRLENIQELVSKAASFGDSAEDPDGLRRFLEEVALVAEVDSVDTEEERVILMTLHSAKGLEFPKVYLSGMEDGLFPSFMSIGTGDPDDLEEERRLCYVGITRAREKLILTAAKSRMINGETRSCRLSRFIEEIPSFMLDKGKTGRGFAFGGDNGESRHDPDGYRRSGQDAFASRHEGSFGRGQGFGAGDKATGGSRVTFGGFGKPAAGAAGMGKSFTVEKADHLDYGPGDRVRHVRFGEGTVLAVENGRRDFEVTVDFDSAGEKHLFASFAKLEKV